MTAWAWLMHKEFCPFCKKKEFKVGYSYTINFECYSQNEMNKSKASDSLYSL